MYNPDSFTITINKKSLLGSMGILFFILSLTFVQKDHSNAPYDAKCGYGTESAQQPNFCVCNPYYGKSTSSQICDYKRVNKFSATIVQLWAGWFGGGFWYIGHTNSAVMQGTVLVTMIVATLLYLNSSYFSVCPGPNDNQFLLVFAFFWVAYVAFYAINIIMFGIGQYKDGNGYGLGPYTLDAQERVPCNY